MNNDLELTRINHKMLVQNIVVLYDSNNEQLTFITYMDNTLTPEQKLDIIRLIKQALDADAEKIKKGEKLNER